MSESLKYNQRQNKKNLHTGIYMSCGNRISKDSTPWYWLWSRTYRGGGESDKDVTAIEYRTCHRTLSYLPINIVSGVWYILVSKQPTLTPSSLVTVERLEKFTAILKTMDSAYLLYWNLEYHKFCTNIACYITWFMKWVKHTILSRSFQIDLYQNDNKLKIIFIVWL